MRVAVVGLGSIGRRHVRVIKRHCPEMVIVAVRSGVGQRVPEDDLVDHRVTTIEEALSSDIDGAILSSPASLHVEQAISFLRANVPILIEKPLCAEYHDARRLLSAEFRKQSAFGRSLVGYVLRYEPAYQRVKEVITDKTYGAIRGARVEVRSYLPRWRPGQDYRQTVSAQKRLGGGVLRELSHEIDYVLSLIGDIRSVFGRRNLQSTIDIDTEEQVEILSTIKGGMPISMYLDFGSDLPKREFRIWFERGEVVWDLLNQTVVHGSSCGVSRKKALPVDRDEVFALQLQHFCNCIDSVDTPVCGIGDGIKVMAVIAAVEESFRTNCLVECA